jgi:hypothetical protein
MCIQIEQAKKQGITRDLFKKIKEITGNFKPRMSAIKDEDVKDKTEGKEVKERNMYAKQTG